MIKEINMQMFADAISGRRIFYMYRILKEANSEDAKGIAFTTDNETSISKDADAVTTKDGTMRTPNAAEIEITAESLLAKGDTLIGKLKQAMLKDEVIEIWEINLDEEQSTGDGKFKSTYYQGYLTEMTTTSSAEDYVSISLTFGVNGEGAEGYATVSQQQQELAAYVFADTKKTDV